MTLSHLPGPVINPAPGHVQLPAINILHHDKFLAPRQIASRHCASAFSGFIYRDYFPAVYQTCTATAPARNKTCTRTAKSTPYLSCHRDNFLAKVPGPVAGWLRQVTQPPFIAGPLAQIFQCVMIRLTRQV
jgi:hypothetical protein